MKNQTLFTAAILLGAVLIFSCASEKSAGTGEAAGTAAAAEQSYAPAAPTNATQQEKDDALVDAIINDDAKAAEKAIVEGANINMKGLGGMNALAMAGLGGHMEIVTVIMAHGGDVNAPLRNRCKDTLLMLALRSNKTEFAKWLLENGADVNAVNYRNATALIAAACKADAEMVELLIAKGADLNVKGAYAKQTALERARALKRDEVAAILVAAGATE